MKFLFVILVFAAIASTIALKQISKANFPGFVNECITSSNVSSNAVDKLRSRGTDIPEGENYELKEFATCFFKKTGVLNNGSEIDVETFTDFMYMDPGTRDNIMAVAIKCKKQAGNKDIDVALNFWLCINRSELKRQ